MVIILANEDFLFPGYAKAFEPVEMSHVITGTKSIVAYLGKEVDFTDPQSFDPLIDGVRLMSAQRHIERFERAYDAPAHRIGGGCEVAIVGRRGVQVRTLWEWPDVLGEMIDPVSTQGNPICG
jgi:hypothetical protein